MWNGKGVTVEKVHDGSFSDSTVTETEVVKYRKKILICPAA